MKKRIMLAVCLSALCGWADGPWRSDYESALLDGRMEKKFVLAYFSSYETQQEKILLEQEVFTTDTFLSYATNRFVLVHVRQDGPLGRQPPREREFVDMLFERHYVRETPTVYILDRCGHQVAKPTYVKGGADYYVEMLKRLDADLRKTRPEMDK